MPQQGIERVSWWKLNSSFDPRYEIFQRKSLDSLRQNDEIKIFRGSPSLREGLDGTRNALSICQDVCAVSVEIKISADYALSKDVIDVGETLNCHQQREDDDVVPEE